MESGSFKPKLMCVMEPLVGDIFLDPLKEILCMTPGALCRNIYIYTYQTNSDVKYLAECLCCSAVATMVTYASY